MKVLSTILLITLCAFVACEKRDSSNEPPSSAVAERTCSDGSALALSGSGIGALRLGARADSVIAHCLVTSDSTMQDAEGGLQRVLAIRFGPALLHAEISGDTVWRITTRDSVLRTEEGLGVGSPLATLLLTPDVVAYRGEGTVMVQVPRHCGMSFQLDPSSEAAVRGGATISYAELKALPELAQISRVLMTGCP
ncbi:MAG: hypothetical protein ACO1Q7_18040 [Gemmatimonas sp.]